MSWLGYSAGFNWSHSCGCTQLGAQLGLMVLEGLTRTSGVSFGMQEWLGWLASFSIWPFIQDVFTAWWLQGSMTTRIRLLQGFWSPGSDACPETCPLHLTGQSQCLGQPRCKGRERLYLLMDKGEVWLQRALWDGSYLQTNLGISKGLILLIIITLYWTISGAHSKSFRSCFLKHCNCLVCTN